MRDAGTHFEQVPKAVAEKILAEQDPPALDEIGGEENFKKRDGDKTKMRSRKS